MEKLTVAICSYNRCNQLPKLIYQLRQQTCPIPFDILIVNNNSSDDTINVLQKLSTEAGPPLRFVTETKQGIAHARNRSIEECIESDYMFVMDDDELPSPGLLDAAYHSLSTEENDCVGGKVEVKFKNNTKPKWLGEDLLGFLAETNYGNTAFSIKDDSTPIWTANIAYRVGIFRENADLRFDIRYNRSGKAVGGGEDEMMFNEWLKRSYKLAYNPAMIVDHYVESWRLKQSYFYRLHFISGKRNGLYELPEYKSSMFGVPAFLFKQAFSKLLKTLLVYITNSPNKVRQGMNASHAFGIIYGYYCRNK